ncbi:MAG TPA: dienelactone hydrolase family protein [Candidatus Eisenbacteria bacterium]|nr:dienelactone hydrolase family protein [Candidatus Eisenbacteria bacterium]
MKRSLWIFVFTTLLFSPAARAAVHTETVEYRQGDKTLEGYLAYDDASPAKRPGVLVVHEWKGLDEYVKRRAEQLAGLGYVAFAADIYGKGVRPKTHEEAGAISASYRNDKELMRARTRAGLDVLAAHPLVDASRLAAIGYCFGGAAVLELARSGADLRGVVTFHGVLDPPVPGAARNIKAKIRLFHGAADPYVSPEAVRAFEDEMKAAGVDYRIVSYPGVAHSFTVPNNGAAPTKGMVYDEKADFDSWQKMQEFFAEIFA